MLITAHPFINVWTLFNMKVGQNKMILNRDNQAGFGLDTNDLYTHQLHKATALTDKPETTTRTDYVNTEYALVIKQHHSRMLLAY